ncbi:MAG: hypothetical protein M1827_005033 [Pycnora praestabilis]|nr:MAG: hypothetical protein M1827_005033 [Pycnora praestabilis]
MGSYTQGNDTYACNSEDCSLSCASPEFGSGVCYGLQQNFLDGTACGGGGKCANGQCKGSSVGKEIGSWISRNKPLVIGIAAGLGGLLLLFILSCLVRCCHRRKQQPRRKQPSWPPPQQQQQQGWYQQPPPPSQQPMRGGPPQGWGVPMQDGGWEGGRWQQGPPPPPTYPILMPSVRYA